MTANKTKQDLTLRVSKGMPLVEAALAETAGLLRHAPCWVLRWFPQSDASAVGVDKRNHFPIESP